MQGCALIRANFGINPNDLDEEKFARILCEAVWIENERLKNLARLISEIFAER